MQKFIVVKNLETPAKVSEETTATTTSTTPTTATAPIKICGYLKKKRNRMGGWRKMWFVLQNQLLLSYSSKEDYEKKLVPFKDVINLGPGTIIIPTAALPRFTIETATNIFYTFRCDDCKTCSEWITALVESISVETKTNKIAKRLSFQNKFHSSDEMLPIELKKTPIKISRSCDSIYQNIKTIRNTDAGGRCPKLPIALGTARILERGGGVCQNRLMKENLHQSDLMVHNFRLHDENLEKSNHSTDVCRINRMFKSTNAISSAAVGAIATATTTTTAVTPSSPPTPTAKTTTTTPSPTPSKTSVLRCNHQNREIILSSSCVHQKKRMENLENIEEKDKLVDCNENLINLNNSENTIKERLQNISINDDDLDGNGMGVPQCASQNKKTAMDRLADECWEQTNGDMAKDSLTENTECDNAIVEPIYAVVDLKNKYACRAKKKEMLSERPKSTQLTTSDYEDVNTFSIDFSDEDSKDEHIYEPIQLPELPHHQKSMLWHNLRKINIDAFMDITRRMRETKEKTPAITKPATTFSELGRKFGNHRRSLKNHVRKLYSRDQRSTGTDTDASSTSTDNHNSDVSDEMYAKSMPPSACNYPSDKTVKTSFVMNEVEKYRKGEKQLFGSFGRMRKSRTSLCFDDSMAKKQASRKHDKLQVELKQEIDKRKDDDKKVCHSIFYS